MKIVPTERLEWPPPYKVATEKYASQVRLNDPGELEHYTAGLPFPLLDPNAPQAATKVMWNFSFRPEYTDDVDIRDVEWIDRKPSGDAFDRIVVEHFAFYNNVGRTEVAPIPTDPEATGAGIRYRFGAFPFLEPEDLREFGLMRFRHLDPKLDDNTYIFIPHSGAVRSRSEEMADSILAQHINNLDPDSFFGFSAKIEDFTYKLIGVRPMLAVVHAAGIPAQPCAFDNQRTICPESWEMRRLYIIEAVARPLTWHQKIGSSGTLIPRRILYLDSEGWFITASDQYDNQGKLWKTLATFNAYRDRAMPDARVAIFPFNRIFQVALVDEEIATGNSTIMYSPGRDTRDHDCWYINMGVVTRSFLSPHQMLAHARGD